MLQAIYKLESGYNNKIPITRILRNLFNALSTFSLDLHHIKETKKKSEEQNALRVHKNQIIRV